MMSATLQRILPDDVLNFKTPVSGYLCPLEANIYDIQFQAFEVKDYESGRTVYSSSTPTAYPVYPGDDPLRSVRYTFPAEFLTFKTIRTALTFSVGTLPANNFRMVEMHYFKGELVRVYDFPFGFCIPDSTNSWEQIYDVPEYSHEQIEEYISSPFGHTSDSFYFVDDKLVIHNKAEYQYA
ncbi:hypothetical protein CEUSTIGMA_g6104.t1 [Chlamydomonas eustigma]|uniref:GMP phosphodiesterase delta subunit domain-containing protein n=1 Tax=Chlamydomonas eustigma TaxID=1157962 RepID=A0A250X6J2_9CHLO|nr:hypothetical protein CEUSTIGMA_g6104.t1 [Chlamydomonas eustigma]|eukprot:GAX78666.1 hypothetical protein CEUSTIGMA_g6104.t1 [Chlamydomonas eustigma]